jgi:hypothetical protein
MRILWTLVAVLALTLSSAVTAAADYSIPVSTTAQSGGRGANDTQNLTFVVGQPSPLVAASNARYSLRTGLLRLLVDVRPPVILHTPPSAAVPDRTALEITAAIGDDRTGVETATVFYREGGAGSYRQRAMSRDGSSFSASIPPSAVTERGLLYYIEAADSAGNHSRYPAAAPDSLVDVRVWFEDLPSAFEVPAGKYRMISLPGSTDARPDLVLVDDLGQYDKKVWRLGRWSRSAQCSSGCYTEYPEVPDMDRGNAFWLISKQAVTFDFSGLSTLPRSPFKIHLERGWNQIGTPFAFPTDWISTEILFEGATYPLAQENIVGADTIYVEDNLVSYDGAYHGQEAALAPWHGYWIYNGSTREVDLLMNPYPSIPVLASPPLLRGNLDAVMELVVASPDFPERTGVVGLSSEAKAGWDPMDHREPPPFGDYVRLVFDQPGWGKHAGTYMTDVRPANDDGALWDFQVEASQPVSAELALTPAGRMPQDWAVYVYDRARGLRIGVEDLPYMFQIAAGRRFSLIAGTEEFIRRLENEAGISLVPQIVGVAPNPFRQSIEIAYFTPGAAALELDVFSVEGRLIKTIGVTEGESGIRRVTWHGDSDGDDEVAPGLYFLRLKAGGVKKTTKVIKIQ